VLRLGDFDGSVSVSVSVGPQGDTMELDGIAGKP
jgi:hypothetical protein